MQDRKEKAIGAAVLLVIAKGRGTSEHRLEKAVQAEASRGIASLESGLNLLTTLASISPLTGFLGTVTGMIAAFMSIADAADVNAQIVASGIYEALITTVFGLIIAIVAMSAHSIFSSITDKYTSDLEIACSDLIVQMHEPIQTKTLGFANQADLEGK
ncbi:MAG: MotA/TolQ/ExbB proton channel family protein [Treponema sp.]|nr:MotA/TolQ/ExbB proton channel family protein [Treponema sp.]